MKNIQEIIIDNDEAFFDFFMKTETDPKSGRERSSCLYRGLPNVDYRLITSLGRNCKERKDDLEKSILRNFSKYAQILDPSIPGSVWRQMVIGQHHGLPTRLLDWTYSPLIALHFALGNSEPEEIDQNDGVVWEINIDELIKLYPESYRDMLDQEHAWAFTVDMLQKITLPQFDADMGKEVLLFLEPPSIDQRIISQYSLFSVVPKEMADIEDFLDRKTKQTVKYIVKSNFKWHLRDKLDQLNMNERTLLPGLDGLCLWLKRHYYVR